MNEEKIKEVVEKLKEPFERKDIEFRVAKASKRTRQVLVLAYITSRAVMDRLDDVVGTEGWKDEYEALKGGVTCKLSVKLNGEFVCKQDAAPFTNIEALKGAFSDALKRTAVKFGIGRYLYQLPEYWVEFMEKKPVKAKNVIHRYHSDNFSGWWIEPDLPAWAVKDNNGIMEEIERKEDIVRAQKTERKETISDVSNVESANNLRPLLQKRIDYLMKKNIITQKKHSDYKFKITDSKTGKGLLNYFLKQFELLYRMHKLLELNKITEKDQKALYQRIMQAKTPILSKIDADLHKMEDIS